MIEQVVNETWYIYGINQTCNDGSGTTFPPNIFTSTTLIPCAQVTTSWARIIQATTQITISQSSQIFTKNDFLWIFFFCLTYLHRQCFH